MARRADAVRHRVLPYPRVRAARVDTDREVTEQRDLRAGRRELLVEEPLEPAMKAKPVVLRRREASDARTLRSAELGRPCRPSTAVTFGEGAVHRELTQPACTARHVRVEGGLAGETCPEELERRQLQGVHLSAVDDSLAVE